jgi:hypothetical protein
VNKQEKQLKVQGEKVETHDLEPKSQQLLVSFHQRNMFSASVQDIIDNDLDRRMRRDLPERFKDSTHC